MTSLQTDTPRRVSFERHNGWVGPADLSDTLNIIGVGATGSNAAVLAAKQGFHNFRIWDHDVVEAHNLPNQAFDIEHIGMPKVQALAQVLTRFNPDIKVEANQFYFTAAEHGADLEGPLILTVDSMKAREEITECFDGNVLVETVIESRLGFDHGEVNIIDPTSAQDLTNWRNSLLSDDEVQEGPCGLRICPTMVLQVASFMVRQLCQKYAANRTGATWQPNKKTMICFTESGLITHAF